MRLHRTLMPAVLLGALLIPQALRAEAAANKDNAGQTVAIKPFLRKGKTNIVDFFSRNCPPCMALSPRLERLAQARADINVVKLDIDRPGSPEIDWQSPLARQFSLQSIPHFKIYDGKGRLLQQGDPAFLQINAWLKAKNL